MTGPRTTAGGNDLLLNLGLRLLVGAVALAGLLRGAASMAAHLSGAPSPSGGLEAAIDVVRQPGRPGAAFGTPSLSAVTYWAIVVALLLAAAGVAWGAWRLLHEQASTTHRDPHHQPGTATAADVRKAASKRQLLKRARDLRPSLQHAKATDLGYLLGTCRGHEIWTSVEDSTLVLGPPRSGKGLHLVINAILDAPGAVVTTSTRPDNLAITIAARERVGPVAVFDPQGLAGGITSAMRWSPVRGCERAQTAMARAHGFAASTGLQKGGGTDSGGFWEKKTKTTLQGMLHAAALAGLGARDLYDWSLSPAAAEAAVQILASHRDAAPGWADALSTEIHADPRTRDSVWMGVSLALDCLADPQVMDAVTPRPGEDFDPAAFIAQRGTLYLLGTAGGAAGAGPLVAAFIEDLVEVARRTASTLPKQRLDPPLLLALDEIGNLAPLPSLPQLMSDGGGSGITTMPVLQSMSQARSKWGIDDAGTIWDSSIVKVLLGGGSVAKDLQDVSALIGERDEVTDSVSVGADGLRSTQRSTRRVPIMPPEALRTLPFGTAVALLRSAPVMITDLRAWTRRADAASLRCSRESTEAELMPTAETRANSVGSTGYRRRGTGDSIGGL
ncbi:type IV secretory system conjugative DNA transfer family protein [Xylanimonas ulmi]|uniref:Type IV secretory pathway TraG/TraD family ATPase VirD4 n=1 Tax=Xylanimonas ulmi TaxID=228973 RepID=A0A4Q7M2C8_9MICO|nr:TraM recognition domain-containing protein [Xylanibacterium ulmi]RZS60752.1 type IV secretory pathway TraG/TraD family ATPase VirD4 [Xylanibacterium ulmi]